MHVSPLQALAREFSVSQQRRNKMADLDLEWQKLCDEHEAARDAYFNAFAPVNEKFRQIGQGASKTNPSETELDEFDSTWNAWQDIKRRMDEFIKKNT